MDEQNIDKQLLEIYKDFDYEELLWLVENPEEIETGTELPNDDVIAEHLEAINFKIERRWNKNEL